VVKWGIVGADDDLHEGYGRVGQNRLQGPAQHRVPTHGGILLGQRRPCTRSLSGSDDQRGSLHAWPTGWLRRYLDAFLAGSPEGTTLDKWTSALFRACEVGKGALICPRLEQQWNLPNIWAATR